MKRKTDYTDYLYEHPEYVAIIFIVVFLLMLFPLSKGAVSPTDYFLEHYNECLEREILPDEWCYDIALKLLD